jgi:hypothetical protein
MSCPRKISARTSNITITFTKSLVWAGGFFAGALVSLAPAPADQQPIKEKAPQIRILEADVLAYALNEFEWKAKEARSTLIYFAGHGLIQPGQETR